MAIPLRDSFIDVHLEEAELTQHVLDVIKARPTGPERRAAIAYLPDRAGTRMISRTSATSTPAPGRS